MKVLISFLIIITAQSVFASSYKFLCVPPKGRALPKFHLVTTSSGGSAEIDIHGRGRLDTTFKKGTLVRYIGFTNVASGSVNITLERQMLAGGAHIQTPQHGLGGSVNYRWWDSTRQVDENYQCLLKAIY